MHVIDTSEVFASFSRAGAASNTTCGHCSLACMAGRVV